MSGVHRKQKSSISVDIDSNKDYRKEVAARGGFVEGRSVKKVSASATSTTKKSDSIFKRGMKWFRKQISKKLFKAKPEERSGDLETDLLIETGQFQSPKSERGQVKVKVKKPKIPRKKKKEMARREKMRRHSESIHVPDELDDLLKEPESPLVSNKKSLKGPQRSWRTLRKAQERINHALKNPNISQKLKDDLTQLKREVAHFKGDEAESKALLGREEKLWEAYRKET